ncbi:MAG: CBS domain-containing protein [Mycobacteriales bacterium]
MRINEVLRRKGSTEVATIDADETVQVLVSELAKWGVGALVVVGADGTVQGIVSERDVVRRLADSHADLLEQRVRAIMTADVVTCRPDDDIVHVLRMMTDRRIRHVPVVTDRGLGGLVSIGDMVKSRIDDLQTTAESLHSYIAGQ